MVHKVKLHKGALDYFRRLARESPLEIQAYMIGEVVSPTLTVIDSFEYTRNYGTQTPSEVTWFSAEYDRVVRKAEKRNLTEKRDLRVVGDIHSHPGVEYVLSEADYRAALNIGTRVSGICSVIQGRTAVRFWVMDCALPCDTIYSKRRRAS